MKCALRLFLITQFVTIMWPEGIMAQHYLDYKKSNYEWMNKKPAPSIIPADYLKEEAVIVNEENVITFGGGEKEENLLIFNQKKSRVKIQSKAGREKYRIITLPESYDPLYDHFSCSNDKAKTTHFPLYWDVSLYEFSARIIKPDGRVVKAVVKDNFKESAILDYVFDTYAWSSGLLTSRYRNAHYYEFEIQNLEVDDELEYYYRLEIPYCNGCHVEESRIGFYKWIATTSGSASDRRNNVSSSNWYHFNNARIFFNGSDPKMDYSLAIKENKKNSNRFYYFNGAEYDTTYQDDSFVTFEWKRKNLSGNMDEPNTRPARDLPYINYSLKTQSDFYRFNNVRTGSMDYLPPWLFILRAREIYDFDIRRSATGWIKDKQNLLLRDFIQQKTEGLSDSMKYQKLINIHNTIVDSFAYMNDDLYFAEEESGLIKLGSNLQDKKIRELARNLMYSKLLNFAKIDYYTIYVLDKRVGELSKNYLTQIYNTDYLFGPLVKGNIIYTYPKKSNFGYYLDEIPFYWENCNALLLNYNDLFYDLKFQPNIITTPASSLTDNIRMSNVMVQVSLDTLTAVFDAKISLSGQFSTMTRGIYTRNEGDSTINPLYRKPVWSLNGNGQLISNEMTNADKIFPFKHDFRIKYRSDKLVIKTGDDFSIDLTAWFNHIIYPGLKAEGRTLKFYPDFIFQDTYRYMIRFDKNITLKDSQQSFEKENEFGKLIITIKQVQDDALLLESFFVVKEPELNPDKVDQVQILYDEIEKLNKSQIRITVKK